MKEKSREYLTLLVRSFPQKPGVYQFFDEKQKLLYVGKAKNLKKRVQSYFNREHKNNKLALLVKKICDIKHIVVESESDAMLLENNLIKKHQPRYNVQLRDDKSFPWICVKNERFPRVFYTRNVVKDGSVYFGPYTSVRMVKTLLDLIKQLYPLRTCNYNLSQENIDAQKYKACLEYHIGNCKGPCEGMQDEKEYNEAIKEIKDILKGNIRNVTDYLSKMMNRFAQNEEFEKAHQVKEKIEILDKYQSKSTIVNPSINDVDVFSLLNYEKSAYVNFLKVVNGAIIQAHTMEIRKKLDEPEEDLLTIAVTDIRLQLFSSAKEVIVPFHPGMELEGVKFTVPQKGDKKKLLELSERNARFFRQERIKLHITGAPKSSFRKLETLKEDLRLKELPEHIECFDNSNIQGSIPVAACVVFKNGKPKPSEYRHYNIKTVKGANNFASMEEIVFRRYKRLTGENAVLPQLIVIDGGKGQLNAAVKSLEKLNLKGKIPVIGIAKKLEEIFFPGDPVPLYLDKTSESLRLIQHIRNEAHRFGINFHRHKRDKDLVKTELENIRGIGVITIQQLLTQFKSVDKIQKMSFPELEKAIGKSKAKRVFEYFHAGS